jgi:hypothetical protein
MKKKDRGSFVAAMWSASLTKVNESKLILIYRMLSASLISSSIYGTSRRAAAKRLYK